MMNFTQIHLNTRIYYKNNIILIFPAFLLLALYTQEKRLGLRHFLVGGFAALQAILMLFFVVGLPAIA